MNERVHESSRCSVMLSDHMLCDLPEWAHEAFALKVGLNPPHQFSPRALERMNPEERARREKEIWDAYYRAVKPSQDAYRRAAMSALDTYDRAIKPAQEARDRALAELEAER